MNKELNDIRKLINQRLANATKTTFYGIVDELDIEKRTCRIQVGEVYYDSVLLYAAVDPGLPGRTVFPAQGSRVLVTRIEGSDRLYVSMFSEIESIEQTIGSKRHTMQINESGIRISHKKEEEGESGEQDEENEEENDITFTLNDEGIELIVEDNILKVNTEKTVVVNGDTTFTIDGSGVEILNGETTFTVDGSGMEAKNGQTVFQASTAGYSITSNGNDLLDLLAKLCSSLMVLQVPTAMGPSGVPINIQDFTQLMTDFTTLKA